MDALPVIVAVLAIISPIASAAYVVGSVRAQLSGLRRDVDRHERELIELRHSGARG